MKTVIDAVNEFEGEIAGSYIYAGSNKNKLNKGTLQETLTTLCNNKWCLLCTVDEFNDLVSKMETNFGKITRGALGDYIHGDKELLTKSTKELDVMDIWKDAPESATHYDIEAECFCKNDGYWTTGNRARYVQDNTQVQWGDEDRYTPRPMFIDCKVNNEPQPTLTYTQAMADNGELPGVGMECRFDTTFFTTTTSNRGVCEIIAYYGGKVWINIIDFDCVINLSVIEFKPLTPPIELIDGKAYQFEYQGEEITGLYGKMDNEFFILGGSYSVEICTNIQPLTVEVK